MIIGNTTPTAGLKPCPFCGGSAILRTDGLPDIKCMNCYVTISNGERSIIKLKDQWNYRPLEKNITP